MNTNSIKNLKETELWTLYNKMTDFMNIRNIYTDTDKNNRMYNGDQWYGLKIEGIEKIQHNFIKTIVKQKVGTITSNLFAVNYSPENIENKEFTDLAQKTCELLNKKASKVFDKDFMDKKIKKWAKQSAINDEAVCYVNYNFDTNMPENEVISKNDIMYGNENEEEIQLQPYILLRKRETVLKIRDIAEKEGLSKDKIDLIVGDKDTSTVAGDSGKEEVDDKCWLITKMYRENGTIHFEQGTRYCTIKKDKDTGCTLYPIAHFNWEDQEGNARGVGEVRQLIPNQLEVNKTAMRRALTVKNLAYPQKVIDIDSIANPEAVNRVGANIKFKGMNGKRASDVFMASSPAQMSTDSEKLQSELITYSRELNNASDATTGSINPEQASGKAILAVQNAQNQPLTDQVIGLKSFIEDIARIWFEMWKVYASNLTVEVESTDENGKSIIEQIEIPSYVMEELSTSVKVDITPKGAFDKYAQELSLENLFTNGQITIEEYVKALPVDSVMPKPQLEEIVKNRKEAQDKINQMEIQGQQMQLEAQRQQTNAMEIENINNIGQQMINQATLA